MKDTFPHVFHGRRRWLFATLIGLGIIQAVLSVAIAFYTPQLGTAFAKSGLTGRAGSASGPHSNGTGMSFPALAALLVLAALLLGVARMGERVVAEELGNDYVRSVRKLLITAALAPQRPTSLGTTIARSTNDLSAVKNWVSLGIAPLVVGVPLLAGIVVGMFLLIPALGTVILGVLVVFGVGLLLLSRPLLGRARRLRKVRGRMASQISDIVQAGPAIRVSGGINREVTRIDQLSARVQRAARSRAVVSGAMRGGASAVTALLSVLIGVVGSLAAATPEEVTTAIFIAGLMASPIQDLGRVGEYRQNFRAAARVLYPIFEDARLFRTQQRQARKIAARSQHRGDIPGLAAGALHLVSGGALQEEFPELVARPGARIIITGSPTRVNQVLRLLVGEETEDYARMNIAGRELALLPATVRRELVGVALRDVPLERASIARIVRYRLPQANVPVHELLEQVGLAKVVAELPDEENTVLKRGGKPLSVSAQALLQLARAIAGNPPLLVLDRIDEPLNEDGLSHLRHTLENYPGILVANTQAPEKFLDSYTRWNVDENNG